MLLEEEHANLYILFLYSCCSPPPLLPLPSSTLHSPAAHSPSLLPFSVFLKVLHLFTSQNLKSSSAIPPLPLTGCSQESYHPGASSLFKIMDIFSHRSQTRKSSATYVPGAPVCSLVDGLVSGSSQSSRLFDTVELPVGTLSFSSLIHSSNSSIRVLHCWGDCKLTQPLWKSVDLSSEN
jgi:hypothetical protein